MHKTTSNTTQKSVFLSALMFDYLAENKPTVSQTIVDYIQNCSLTKSIQELLDYQFQSIDFFIQAITHTSFVNEFPHLGFKSNERLEYLGDAVIDLIMASILLDKFPTFNEGKLSKLRSALVNESSLTLLSNIISLNQVILLGKGEIKTKGHLKSSLLSNVFEAIIGAIFQDGGYEACLKVFRRVLELYKIKFQLDFIREDLLNDFDPKSRLQEITMSQGKGVPVYLSKVLADQKFNIDLMIGKKIILSSTGNNKKQLERDLAQAVLKDQLYL